MARSVSVFLRANVTGFVSQVRRAGTEVGRLSRTIDESSGRQRRAFQRTGQAATVMAVGLVGGFALATKATMDFDRQMSAVDAAAGATAAQMDKLRKAALEAGKSTAFSATQAAQAEEELVKAGVSAADVIGGGLKGALDLASAGQLQVGEAAEVAATAMTQFNLAGKDVPHIADLLSAGANKAQGTVHQLGFAMRMGGLVASQFGLSVEDTVGSLSAFASAGLLGSDSGTSFKTMLIHLAAPSKKSANLMRELGINAYDSTGKFVGITALAGQLEHQLGGLSQAQRDAALSIIFGTDGMRAANVLYRQGARGMEGWINKVNDSGNAARTAAKKLDNLHGDLTKLKGAFTTALIGAGSGAQSPLRGLTQSLTSVVNAFNSIPPSAQSATYWIAGISGGALLAARGLLFTVGTIRDTRTALAALNLAAIRSRISLAAIGKGAGALAVVAGVAYTFSQAAKLSDHLRHADTNVKALTTSLGELGRTGKTTGELTRLYGADLKGVTRDIGRDLGGLGDALKQVADPSVSQAIDQWTARTWGKFVAFPAQATEKIKGLDQALAGLVKSGRADEAQAAFSRIAAEAAKQGISMEKLKSMLPQFAAAQKSAATSAMSHAEAAAKLDAAMTDATVSAQHLQDALEALTKSNMDADRAAIAQARAAQAAAKASDHRRGVTLEEKSALLDLAETDQKQLVAMKNNGATADQLSVKQAALAAQFIRTAMGLGKSRAEATEAAKRYGLLGSAADLTTLKLGTYVGRVRTAADQARNLASKTGGAAGAQAAYASRVQSSLPVLYALAGGNRSARAQVDALAKASGVAAGKQTITRDAFLKTAKGMGIARGKARDLWKEFLKIKSRKVNLDVYANGHWGTGPRAIANGPAHLRPYAKGGPVPSIGPDSSRAHDSVPAILRVDEHVWTPEEVDAVGGHAAMYRMRAMALAGKLRGYATGGRVSLGGGAGDAVKAVYQPIYAGYSAMVTTMAQLFAAEWKKFAASGGPVVQAARSQIGLPYSWGGGGKGGPSYGIGRGAGTYGFDCSGLTEYGWWQGRRKDIGGVTDTQWANSTPIPGPRPGALAFPSGPSVHVMMGSSKPGYVIQAPYTGSHVQEVPRTSSNWRWPTGLAAGGEVKLGRLATAGRASHDDAMLAKVLQIAGSGPRGAERHTAQVAPAGAMRLWAEPETGGEAYIPLADSKRHRSKQILATVARKFGMAVKGMADGGILSYADGGTTDNLNLSDYLSTWRDKYQPASRSDVDAASKARRTQLDQLRNAEDALYKARHKRHKSARDIAAAERRVRKEREDLAAATTKLASVEGRYRAGRQSPASQLGSALALGIRNTGTFMKNLMTLADRGFGPLAQQLLSMGGAEAESIAASAVKMSNKSLGTLQGQVQTAQRQQEMLTQMPNILTARTALKNSSVRTWMDLIRVAELPPEDLAGALRMMQADLFKTKYGKTIWAQMIAQGYQHGGWITGASGIDRVPIAATAGEFMVSARPAAKYAPALEAINGGSFDAMLRRYVHGGGGGSAPARGGDGGSQPLIGELNVNHVPGYSIPQDVTRALRQVELSVRYNRRR